MAHQDLRHRTYLPLFYDVTDRVVLIVGAGGAGWQKARALEAFGCAVTVISPEFAPHWHPWADAVPGSRRLEPKLWDEGDLAPNVALVLACTNDPVVNGQIVAAARARGLPVLDAALPAQGDFVQPATKRVGPFVLAISSGGTGPRKAVEVRDALAEPFEAAVARALEP